MWYLLKLQILLMLVLKHNIPDFESFLFERFFRQQEVDNSIDSHRNQHWNISEKW